MTSPLDTGNRWAVLGVTLFVLGCAGVIADRAPAAVLVNESPSLPMGIYIRAFGTAPEPGSVVTVPQPASVRAYLAHLGMPDDVRLIKRVAATAGDPICAVDDHMVLPDRIVRVRRKDRQGVPLPAWVGCRRLGPGELFLLGDTPSSFDSRYFGPVRDDQVEGVFKEVLTW